MLSRLLLRRQMGQGERFPSVPLLEPGGAQPYSPHGGQAPGPALHAMKGGSTLFGVNPMDVQRKAQVAARGSLLGSLRR